MNWKILAGSVTACASCLAADPSVSGVSFTYGGAYEPSRISYVLSGAPAIVTIDIETNTLANGEGDWAPVGGEATGRLVGAVSTVVRTLDENVSALWWPAGSWSGKKLPAGAVRARITAYPTNSPPDYMVVDVADFTNSVRFYSCEASLPGGIGSALYRTDAMVMRRIPAANVVWRMGIPEGVQDAGGYNTAHNVLLTEDYYMGVFELTQGQYSNYASNPSITKDPFCPVSKIDCVHLRGQNALLADDPYGWPKADHPVSPASVIGKMRKHTGLKTLDIPTDAQWEYACRAGTGTRINTGKASPSDADWDAVAWSLSKAQKVHRPVGTKLSNNWGLYDMHGNVLEFCLDWYATNHVEYVNSFQEGWESGAVTTNPVGVAFSATNAEKPSVVKRGGSVSHGRANLASGYHMSGGWTYEDVYIGSRLVCPLSDVVGLLGDPDATSEDDVAQ